MNILPKLISAKQTRQADQHTIETEPITSIDLMERASEALVKTIQSDLDKNSKIAVVSGPGNNGGDGLVIARLLLEQGYDVAAILLQYDKELSKDCSINKQRLQQVDIIKSNNDLPNFKNYDLIIDAIFGSGLTRPIASPFDHVVNSINESECHVISVDIPSGMFCDSINSVEPIIKADIAVSFQRAKRSFFYPEHNDHLQDFRVTNIRLDEGFIQSLPSSTFIINDQVKKLLKKRKRYSHKGSYGHALIMAGSKGMMGAATLSSESCHRSGVGLVSSYVPECGQSIIQSSLPTVLCKVDQEENHLTKLPDLILYNAVGVGPGIGQHRNTKELLRQLLLTTTVPLIIDADALNIMASDMDLLSKLPPESILTPHIKEFDRLAGTSANSEVRYKKQISFSKKYNCIVVLKDAHTCITCGDGQQYFSVVGNPGMATGGSGDVLTGIITGFKAQGYESLHAALLGVFFHGKAGDDAKKSKGEYSLIATDIIDHLHIY